MVANVHPKRARVAGTVLPFAPAQTLIDAIVNVRAEEAVLSAVLHAPERYPELAEIIEAADFWTLWHGFVWHAYGELFAASTPINLLTVADKLADLGQADDDRLAKLLAAAPAVEDAPAYAQTVRTSALYLRICKAADSMKALIGDRQSRGTSLDVIAACNQMLFEATEQRGQADTSALAAVNAYWNRIDALRETGEVPGVPSGFPQLDTLLGGMFPELTVLAGNEGMGKTTFLLSLIRNVLRKGLSVALFSLEMSQAEIVQALIAMEAGIPRMTLRRGLLTQAQYSAFVEAAGVIAKYKLHIIDMTEFPSLTPMQLRIRLRRLLATEALALVVVDGLWLMEPTNATNENADRRPRAVFEITRDLTSIAKTFELPVLLAHQYNGEARNRKDKRPTLFDLAESAGVRRNAQVILGLYRDAYYGIDGVADVTELHVLKDRNNGAQGSVGQFLFNRDYNRYEEV